MGTRATWIFSGIVMLAGACDEGDSDVGFDDVNGGLSLREGQNNAFNLNAFNLNAFNLNAFNLNAFNLNGDAGTTDFIRALDLDHDQDYTPDLWIVGSELRFQKNNGSIKTGYDIKNLKIKFDISDGGVSSQKTIEFTNAGPLSPGSDVWLYDVSVKNGSGPWKPLCVDGLGAPTQAIILGDAWNPSTGARRTVGTDDAVTLACRGAALAKCVEWGYRPWASTNGVSLHDYHQTCTRMVRADYCGEGLAHTTTGTPIHVLDQLGVQNVDPNINYVIEAEWGPNGAVCLNSANTRLPNQSLSCQLPACGTSFSSGGLIQSGKVL